MNDFAPKFPRSVSGRNFRLPFDHPDVEAVGALADRLYRQLPLSERGRLITLYANLAEADFRLWSAIGEQRISDDGSRPASLEPSAREAWMSGATATLGYKIDRCTGYVFRCRDYLQKLADKYSGAEHGTRVRQPGCKFDAMLVLEGAQDLGKSSGICALCPDLALFTDQLEIGADAKITIEKTTGAWIVEMPELDGLGRRDTNRVKSFITTTHDRARLAYARFAVTKPRQFVLFGTTNESQYLSDPTGNRRFWIVRVTRADPAGIAAIRDRLWAEAVQAEPAENL